MFTPTRSRALSISLADHELTVEVDGDAAVLRLVPARRPRPTETSEPADTEPTDEPEPLRLRVPARALVAALRVAWADEHDLRCFEPWRDTTRDGRWRGYEPYEDSRGWYDEPYDGPTRWYDDLGDGDPDGYRDPTVVPFRMPPAPPRPTRAGQPWERQEEEELRDLWLAAAPESDRMEVLRRIAEALERPVGGLFVRLQVVGCDPARPGRRRYEADEGLEPSVEAPGVIDHRG